MQKRLGHTTDRISPTTFRHQPVGTVARREPVIVRPDLPVAEAIAAMQGGDTRSVLVADRAGLLVGILTERDLVQKVLAGTVAPSATVDQVMTADPDAVTMDATLAEALELMEQRGYHGLPIVDGAGRVAGHLDSRDVLEYIAEAFPQEVLNLPPRPHQLMDQPEGA